MIKVNTINTINTSRYSMYFKKVAEAATEILNINEKLVVNIVISNNEVVRDYNNKFRGIDRETDVLSFPSDEDGELGDIIISLDKAKAQAKEYGHSLKRELSFLACHGILHCLGYDHMTKEEETVMFSLQDKILDHADIRR